MPKKRTLKQIIELLKKPLKVRHGIHVGHIFKDKSKYNRKEKHKKDLKHERD